MTINFCSNPGPLILCSVCLKDSKCSACSKCSCEESKCKLHKCCNSCTFCVFERATTKESVSPSVNSGNGLIKPVKDVFL